jgi:hypothetical protein
MFVVPMGNEYTRWIGLVFMLAWTGSLPTVSARKMNWFAKFSFPWEPGVDPMSGQMRPMLENHAARMERPLPSSWNHFYSLISPSIIPASAEVLRWLAGQIVPGRAAGEMEPLAARDPLSPIWTFLDKAEAAKDVAKAFLSKHPTRSATRAESSVAFVNKTVADLSASLEKAYWVPNTDHDHDDLVVVLNPVIVAAVQVATELQKSEPQTDSSLQGCVRQLGDAIVSARTSRLLDGGASSKGLTAHTTSSSKLSDKRSGPWSEIEAQTSDRVSFLMAGLSKPAIALLKKHGTVKGLAQYADLASFGVAVRTVKKLVPKLIEQGVLIRPQGKRLGTQLTEDVGIPLVARLNEAA